MGEIQTGSFRDVAKYKLEQAKDDLDSAKLLLKAEKYKAANNRAYYSSFHAVDSVLALEPVAFKKHKDTLAYAAEQVETAEKIIELIDEYINKE
ncbi:MAG: HEPN domain-containing protein [Lachnospiraceae bacterium]|nr:HEPN domain-containing protein [Lachnospiraceae bacterium]